MSTNKLLILDDDPLTGQTIRNIAALAGFEVELTENHHDFFASLEQAPPDVIALDLIMPDMDGVEVMAELGRRHADCKIIITSGVGSRVLEAAGRSAAERGLDILGVLPKPFTPASLRALLAKCPPAGNRRKQNSLDDSFRAALNSSITRQELEKAIHNGEIHLHYQPKVSCQTGTLSGFEALARWRHPIRGDIRPDDFIALAEKTGLIDPLTTEIVDQALHWFSELHHSMRSLQETQRASQAPEKLTLSVNVSALSLVNTTLFDHINNLCQDLDIHPQSLIFELTETSAMEDPVASMELLTRLRLRGFRLSIDDFGTGYSSMLQLVKLPFSELKVDKSFVITAHDSEESRVVIKSVVGLARNLGLIVTAEGIEDEETLGFLRLIGCTLAQGYHIARPMPGNQVLDWLLGRAKGEEQRRLEALYALGILDTPAEARFDCLVRIATRMLDIPMGGFTLVDSERLWFKARAGITATAVLRTDTFCNDTIRSDQVNVVPDASQDPVFAAFPLVANPPGIRFYAGCPVHAADGSRIGSLIMLDSTPREFGETKIQVLRGMATLLERELYLQPQDCLDLLTGTFNHQAMESWLPELLQFCKQLQLRCLLHVFELEGLSRDSLQPAHQHGSYYLTNFARLLRDCFPEADLVGRFDRDKFLVLQIGTEENEARMATWKLQSAVRMLNQKALAGLELRYRAGLARAAPGGDYHLLSLLDKADQAMPAP